MDLTVRRTTDGPAALKRSTEIVPGHAAYSRSRTRRTSKKRQMGRSTRSRRE
jgi:hypothetical protein